MNELMDRFYENAELNDVICENCSRTNDKISKVNIEKNQSVLNPPMQLRIFLQISEYNDVRYEYLKKKLSLHHNNTCIFRYP